MSNTAEAPAGGPGGYPHAFEGRHWSGRHFGPPLPLKILGVVVAFWIFKPLGVAALAFLLWRTVRRNGGCGFRREGFAGATERGWAGQGRGRRDAKHRLRGAPSGDAATARRRGQGLRGIRAQTARGAGQAGVRQLHGESQRAAKPRRPKVMSACAPAPCGGAICYATHKKLFSEKSPFSCQSSESVIYFSVRVAGRRAIRSMR